MVSRLVYPKSIVCSGYGQRLTMMHHLEPMFFDGLENFVVEATQFEVENIRELLFRQSRQMILPVLIGTTLTTIEANSLGTTPAARYTYRPRSRDAVGVKEKDPYRIPAWLHLRVFEWKRDERMYLCISLKLKFHDKRVIGIPVAFDLRRPFEGGKTRLRKKNNRHANKLAHAYTATEQRSDLVEMGRVVRYHTETKYGRQVVPSAVVLRQKNESSGSPLHLSLSIVPIPSIRYPIPFKLASKAL
ncbi:hypothetical protein EVAR_36295_1 [Eumeta japonica]|uniref:Uncharacterized protein n=1 Tax=Eumeta variegata TaxID=151549 RepID=A0A4C1VI55_EUMVA|nr:hypothetical protein EVAR_36295_1 [Eumeta japonica]